MHDRIKLAIIGALILWSGVLTAFAGLPYDSLDWQRFEQGMVYYGSPPLTSTPTPTLPSTATPTATPTSTATATPTSTATAVRDLPDLHVEYMTIELETAGSCNSGSTALGVRVWIGNVGGADAGAFAVDVNDARQRVDGLAAGVSVALWFSGYAWGANNTAVVDPLAEVLESDEGNNQLAQMLPIPTLPPTCTPTPTPTATNPAPTSTPTATATPTVDHDLSDLIVTEITIEPETGGSCNVTLNMNLGLRVWVQNVGRADAGPFAVDVRDMQGTVRQRADGVAAGANAGIWVNIYVWGGKTALVDALSEVEESNEGNNELSRWFASGWLPPTCTPTSTASVPAGVTSTPTPTPTATQPPIQSVGSVAVSNVTDVGFTLSWTTPFTSTGHAVVSAPGGGSFSAADVRGSGFAGDNHYVRVTGLAPATAYSVTVYSGDAATAALAVNTGPTAAGIPAVDTVAGYVYQADGFTPVGGAVVYLSIEDADEQGSPGSSTVLSALVGEAGTWAIDLPPRRADLQDSFVYGSGDRFHVFAEGGRLGSLVRMVPVGGPRMLGGLNLVPPVVVSIQPGWNLLALPSMEVRQVSAQGALDDLATQGIPAGQVARWQDGHWESHLGGFPANDFAIEPGHGYFVKASGYGTWVMRPRLWGAAGW